MYRRSWSAEKKETKEEEPVLPPRVPCRLAEPHEVPEEAQALFDLAAPSRPALQCKMTYAQAGNERPQPEKGECGTCKAIVSINEDGSLRSHNWPRPDDKKCEAVGEAASDIENGKATCGVCEQVVKVTKKGLFASHNVPNPVKKCDSLGAAPERRIPQPTLPPVESLVLRLAWSQTCYAIGCWVDGEFEHGFIYSDRPLVEKETGEVLGQVSGVKMVKITEYKAYVRAQSQAHLQPA